MQNKPNVLQHNKLANEDGWIGTEISLVISGNWSTYKVPIDYSNTSLKNVIVLFNTCSFCCVQSRIMSYLTQLAIITPYAQFDLRYQCQGAPSRNFAIRFTRRSLQMPPPAKEIKHHPSAVNDLLVKQLIDGNPSFTLAKFLKTQLSNINGELCNRLIGTPMHHFRGHLLQSTLCLQCQRCCCCYHSRVRWRFR